MSRSFEITLARDRGAGRRNGAAERSYGRFANAWKRTRNRAPTRNFPIIPNEPSTCSVRSPRSFALVSLVLASSATRLEAAVRKPTARSRTSSAPTNRSRQTGADSTPRSRRAIFSSSARSRFSLNSAYRLADALHRFRNSTFAPLFVRLARSCNESSVRTFFSTPFFSPQSTKLPARRFQPTRPIVRAYLTCRNRRGRLGPSSRPRKIFPKIFCGESLEGRRENVSLR